MTAKQLKFLRSIWGGTRLVTDLSRREQFVFGEMLWGGSVTMKPGGLLQLTMQGAREVRRSDKKGAKP